MNMNVVRTVEVHLTGEQSVRGTTSGKTTIVSLKLNKEVEYSLQGFQLLIKELQEALLHIEKMERDIQRNDLYPVQER